MNDEKTTLAELRAAVRDFVDARDWRQFHNPKNLAMSMAIESAELMEHFQWLDLEGSARIGDSPEQLRAVREELADVLCYALAFANALDLDVSQALRDKLAANARKYPVERFRGRFR